MLLNLHSFMVFPEVTSSRQQRWISRFLWIYWLVIMFHFFAQLGAYLWVPEYNIEPRKFFYSVLLYPHLLMGGFILAAHLFYRFFPKHSYFGLLLCGTLVSMVIIHLNIDIRIISAVMLLPIIASAIFFRLDLTWTTAVMQIIGFVLLYKFDYWFRYYLNPYDMIATPIFFLVGTLVASIIIINGRYLVKDLENTMMAKQELVIENAIMSKLSKTDALTHLYNQNSFHEFYELAFKYGAQGQVFHLALIDIDHFKQVNDQYGHRIGDMILERVARMIREAIAASDIAARYGGEEFAILLFQESLGEAYTILETIRSKLAGTRHEELGGKPVTISIGLESYKPGHTKESMFEAADALLYEAKHQGRNQTAVSVFP